MRIIDFSDYLYGKGKAERTIREYVKWLRRLTRWADERGHHLPTLSAVEVRHWADETIPLSRESRKQCRVALRHYYQAAGRSDTPWEGIRVPRKPTSRPRPLPPADATLLRDAAIMHGGRQGLAVLLLLYTAARPSEVAGMRWDGIDAGMIRWWRSKTSEWHEAPVHPVLATALDEHRSPAAEGYLFVGNNGRPSVSGTTVWAWTKQVASTVGLEATPRQLRATAGTAVLEATGSIDAVATLLGHRDVNVTRAHYASTSPRRLQEAVDALDY